MEPQIVAAIIGGAAAICAAAIGLYWQRHQAERRARAQCARCFELGYSVTRIGVESHERAALSELVGIRFESRAVSDTYMGQLGEVDRLLRQQWQRAAALAGSVGVDLPGEGTPYRFGPEARAVVDDVRSRLGGLPHRARTAYDAGECIGRLHGAVARAMRQSELAILTPEDAASARRDLGDLPGMWREYLVDVEGLVTEARLPRDSVATLRRVLDDATAGSSNGDVDPKLADEGLTRAFSDLVKRVDPAR